MPARRGVTITLSGEKKVTNGNRGVKWPFDKERAAAVDHLQRLVERTKWRALSLMRRRATSRPFPKAFLNSTYQRLHEPIHPARVDLYPQLEDSWVQAIEYNFSFEVRCSV